MQLANCKQTYLGLLRLSVGMYAYVRLCIWALSWGICFYSLYILNSLLLPLVWPHTQMLYPNSHANTFSVNEYEWHKVYKYINKNICFEFIWKNTQLFLSYIGMYVEIIVHLLTGRYVYMQTNSQVKGTTNGGKCSLVMCSHIHHEIHTDRKFNQSTENVFGIWIYATLSFTSKLL